jgi:hypothetical protein
MIGHSETLKGLGYQILQLVFQRFHFNKKWAANIGAGMEWLRDNTKRKQLTGNGYTGNQRL